MVPVSLERSVTFKVINRTDQSNLTVKEKSVLFDLV